MMDDFEIAQMFQRAVDEAHDAGWSIQRIREELDAAIEAGDLG